MQFKHWLINEEIFEKGNQATIYHRTGKYGDDDVGSIEGIMTHGFKIGSGTAFGPGLYSLVNLEEQLSSDMSSYGNHIFKIVVKNIKNYLITIPYYARKIYNDPAITFQKQVKELGIDITDEATLERYNQIFDFNNPTSSISYMNGSSVSSFVNNYKLWQGKNCKGILYRDNHGLVLLLYPPFDNVMPLAWAKAPPSNTTGEIVWHNIKNVAKINFADANLDYTGTPRRLAYKARLTKKETSMAAKEASEILNYLADEQNYKKSYSEYGEKFIKVAQFLNAKNIKLRVLFKKIPDSVLKQMDFSELLGVMEKTNNNNEEILSIINKLQLAGSTIDIVFATCPRYTNDVNNLRKEMLKLNFYNPDIVNIYQNLNSRIENTNDVIEFTIEESRAIGKSLKLDRLARISPIIYLKEIIKQGDLSGQALENTIEHLYRTSDITDFMKVIKDQDLSKYDVYQKLIDHILSQQISLKDLDKEISESEWKQFFNSTNNTNRINDILRNGYSATDTGEYQNNLFLDLFFKYVLDPTDRQLAYILYRVKNSYDPVEFETTLDMIIKIRKSKNQFLSKEEVIEIIQAIRKFGKESILEKIPDENWAAFDNSDIRPLVYKFNSYTSLITKIAEKFLKYNTKLDADTKIYFEKVISDPSKAGNYIMLPSIKDITEIAEKTTSNDSYYFQTIRDNILNDMGNVSLSPERKKVLEKIIYDFSIQKMNTDKPTENMIDRVLHYLESEIPSYLDVENWIKNIPISILQKIFIDAEYMARFRNLIYQLKTNNNIDISNVLGNIKQTISSDPTVSKLFNVFMRKFRTGAYHY